MGTVCVIGGGPAGSTFAARMAQLGHDVVLVERAVFPRRQLGELLSPGVLPLLDMTGARTAVEAAGFRRVRTVLVRWEGDEELRDDPREQGLIVGRGEFDQILLRRALALGVRVVHRARCARTGMIAADGTSRLGHPAAPSLSRPISWPMQGAAPGRSGVRGGGPVSARSHFTPTGAAPRCPGRRASRPAPRRGIGVCLCPTAHTTRSPSSMRGSSAQRERAHSLRGFSTCSDALD